MRDKLLVFLIGGFLVVMLVGNILTHDKELSYSERRTLQTFPKVTMENLLDASFFQKFDNYTTDQFIKRDEFRKLKAFISYNIFGNYDNNGLYVINDHIFKQEYPYNKLALEKTIKKINDVYNRYLVNNQVYYAIIPDKNYFVDDKYLKLDYDNMFETINNGLEFNYLDITNKLELDDYYLTDPHFKQECLQEVVKTLIEGMDNNYQNITYQKNVLNNFYGSYYSQLGLNNKGDKMIYLTNKYITNSQVNYLENPPLNTVYNLSKYNGMDPYDIYLDGASALIEITNNESLSKKELIIFRDSFGSSIAPLLIPYYQKITLIDLRYLSSNLLDNYVDFDNQDVLFLYSTLIYNTNILK